MSTPAAPLRVCFHTPGDEEAVGRLDVSPLLTLAGAVLLWGRGQMRQDEVEALSAAFETTAPVPAALAPVERRAAAMIQRAPFPKGPTDAPCHLFVVLQKASSRLIDDDVVVDMESTVINMHPTGSVLRPPRLLFAVYSTGFVPTLLDMRYISASRIPFDLRETMTMRFQGSVNGAAPPRLIFQGGNAEQTELLKRMAGVLAGALKDLRPGATMDGAAQGRTKVEIMATPARRRPPYALCYWASDGRRMEMGGLTALVSALIQVHRGTMTLPAAFSLLEALTLGFSGGSAASAAVGFNFPPPAGTRCDVFVHYKQVGGRGGVWEDDLRSLERFVPLVRPEMSTQPSIQIVNIRGHSGNAALDLTNVAPSLNEDLHQELTGTFSMRVNAVMEQHGLRDSTSIDLTSSARMPPKRIVEMAWRIATVLLMNGGEMPQGDHVPPVPGSSPPIGGHTALSRADGKAWTLAKGPPEKPTETERARLLAEIAKAEAEVAAQKARKEAAAARADAQRRRIEEIQRAIAAAQRDEDEATARREAAKRRIEVDRARIAALEALIQAKAESPHL